MTAYVGKDPDPDIDWNDIFTVATYNAQGLNLNNLEPVPKGFFAAYATP